MTRHQRIIDSLTQELGPSHIELTDDSAGHAGHNPAAAAGGTHFTLTIESPKFTGLTRVARHQLIYKLIGKEFDSGLHALAIRAYAPGER